jgi:hypothetical protein
MRRQGQLLAEKVDGNVVCSSNFDRDDPNATFILEDSSKTIVSGATVELSLSDSVYQGIFQKTVPDTIIGAFATNNFAGVIFFAILIIEIFLI